MVAPSPPPVSTFSPCFPFVSSPHYFDFQEDLRRTKEELKRDWIRMAFGPDQKAAAGVRLGSRGLSMNIAI